MSKSSPIDPIRTETSEESELQVMEKAVNIGELAVDLCQRIGQNMSSNVETVLPNGKDLLDVNTLDELEQVLAEDLNGAAPIFTSNDDIAESVSDVSKSTHLDSKVHEDQKKKKNAAILQ